ncbi:hypothetical protein [Paenibacillus contaminans]|nr:hypothetical protein [Paenibacillus contaminans]
MTVKTPLGTIEIIPASIKRRRTSPMSYNWLEAIKYAKEAGKSKMNQLV